MQHWPKLLFTEPCMTELPQWLHWLGSNWLAAWQTKSSYAAMAYRSQVASKGACLTFVVSLLQI